MDKRIKIIVIAIAFLGLVSAIFLLVAKKKTATTATNVSQNQQSALPIEVGETKSANPAPVTSVSLSSSSSTNAPAAKPNVTANAPTAIAKSEVAVNSSSVATAPEAAPTTTSKTLKAEQWQQCKNKTIALGTNLIWPIQVTEAIPAGGTYAKGYLEGDQKLLVHVIIKADAKGRDVIKSRLIVGKKVFVRGNCVDVATDGAVVLQVF